MASSALSLPSSALPPPSLAMSGGEPDQAPQVENSPQNPQAMTGEEQVTSTGLTKDDENTLVDQIISAYRNDWSPDRILRIPYWLKNMEFDKGNQWLSWDPVSKSWFDSIAWFRQNGGSEEDCTYLEKYRNNITQMLRKSYVAAVARGVPPVVVRPENAENLNDVTTAKAAQEAISIIERLNRSLALVRSKAHKLYLFGVYFTRTRFVIDGQFAGFRNVPVLGEKQVVLPAHLHCKGCGTDTPIDQAALNCDCGRDFNMDTDYYPSEPTTIPTVTTSRQERGMPKWTVYGPLQVDTDPTAKHLSQVPLLALDMETDVADLRATFPAMLDKISEGMQSKTDPNAEYSRLARTTAYSQAMAMTADQTSARVTFTQVWVQPRSYYRVQDKAFIARMQRLFPKGCKVSMCGDVVLAVEEAELLKEWTRCGLDDEYGIYSPSIADNVVPFNERFNNSSDAADDWFDRAAMGVVGYDPNRIDGAQMDGKAMLPGVWTPMPSKGQGLTQPLENSIMEFKSTFDGAIFNYQDRLMNFCQLLSGVPPQVFGGGAQEGVETAKGQKQALDQALGKLGVDWSLIKEETAASAQNAIECLQRNRSLAGDLWEVIEERGSEFRNNYVHMEELAGKVRVYEQIDEGLPMTAEERRAWWQKIFDTAEKNPASQAFLDVPANQTTMAAVIGDKDAVVPGAAAIAKTLQDIYKLLQSAPTPRLGPNGQPQLDDDGSPLLDPSIAPDKWVEDYPRLEATVLQYCKENCDLKTSNPRGWQNLIAYYRLACQYEVEVESFHAANKLKVQQAGAPKPPAPAPPDPNVKAAQLELFRVAKDEVDRLQEISHLPPLGKNQSVSAQVAAGKENIDTALKVAQAMTQ